MAQFRFVGISRYITVAALLFGAADFLTPVLQGALGISAAWLPALVYAGIGGLGLLLPERLGRFLEPEAKDSERMAFRQLSGAMVCLGVVWAVLMASSLGEQARQSGVIAALFPPVAEAQDGLLGELAAIKADTAETSKDVKKLVTFAEEDRQSPSGQLQRLGIDLTNENFRDAFDRADTRVLSLFLEAGWPVKSYYPHRLLEGRALAFDQVGWNADVAQLFLTHKDQIDPGICQPVHSWHAESAGIGRYSVPDQFFERVTAIPQAPAFYGNLCGREKLVGFLERFVTHELNREDGVTNKVAGPRALLDAL